MLQRRGYLSRASYLTAVSGGAYIASAYAIATREIELAAAGQATGPRDRFVGDLARESRCQFPIFGRGSPEEEHLRNNSSYLAPMWIQKLRGSTAWVFGLLMNLVVIGFLLVLAGALLGWLFWAIHPCLRTPRQATCPGGQFGSITSHWWLIGAGLVWGAGVAIGALQVLFRRRWPWIPSANAALMIAGTTAAIFLALPYALLGLRHLFGNSQIITQLANVSGHSPKPSTKGLNGKWVWIGQLVAIGNVVLATVRQLMAKKRSIYALVVAAVAGPVLLLVPFLVVVNWVIAHGVPLAGLHVWRSKAADAGLLGGIVVVALYVLEFWFNASLTTVHPWYRDRLSTVFAIRRSFMQVDKIQELNDVKLTTHQPLEPDPYFPDSPMPTFVYCAAANSMAEGKVPPGRNAVPFVFDAELSGGHLTKAVETRKLEVAMPALTLPAAVAISGAAISPTMGKFTHRLYTFLLTLLNVRLGVWVPNPRFLGEYDEWDAFDRSLRARLTFFMSKRHLRRSPGARYLVYEFLGWHRLDRRYLYLTDGGHYDNLGLVELLRRGCTTILCFDASGDKVDTFFTLGEAIQIARTDLRVEFEIEPEALSPPREDDLSPKDFVRGTFRYPPNDQGEVISGKIVYVKTAVTRRAPWDVRAFHLKDKRFPSHSTIDQLFTDEKFESYRRLGEQAADDALDDYETHEQRQRLTDLIARYRERLAGLRGQ